MAGRASISGEVRPSAPAAANSLKSKTTRSAGERVPAWAVAVLCREAERVRRAINLPPCLHSPKVLTLVGQTSIAEVGCADKTLPPLGLRCSDLKVCSVRPIFHSLLTV